MFLIDKYVPKDLNNIYFHKDTYNLLHIMSMDSSIPHLIFHGSVGVGKHTMVNLFLFMLFGEQIYFGKQVKYSISESGNKTNEEQFYQSHHHIVITPRGTNHDRYLLHDVVKSFVNSTTTFMFNGKHRFKIVVIDGIDRMTFSVQSSLRRTIEQHSDKCRFILIAENISKIIKPLISRSMCVQVPSPNDYDIITFIFDISRFENIELTFNQFSYIMNNTHGNIKNILWFLEMFKLNKLNLQKLYYNFVEMQHDIDYLKIKFNCVDIYDYIKNIVDTNILEKKRLYCIQLQISKYFNKLLFELNKLVNKDNAENVNTYFKNTRLFMQFIDKIKLPNSILNNILNIKRTMHNVFVISSTFDIKTDKDIAIYKITKFIKHCDISNIIDIRDVFFNLIITNISKTEIVKSILYNLLYSSNITELQKFKLIKLYCEIENGITKGRRSINQFDRLVIESMNILST